MALRVVAVHVDIDYWCCAAVGVWVVIIDFDVDEITFVYHGWGYRPSRSSMCFLLVQKFAQSRHTSTREHAKDIALVLVKFRRGLSAECKKLVPQECLYASQAQMREFWTIVKEDVNALKMCQYD